MSQVEAVDGEPSPEVEDARTAETAAGSWQQRFGFPVKAYVVVAAVLVVVAWFSYQLLDPYAYYGQPEVVFPGSGVLGGWFRYDGGWYRGIALSGYSYNGPGQQASVAFFPAYPMLMRLVAVVVRNEVLAGMAITFACGVASAVLIYRWTLARYGESVARLSVLLLLVYPYAMYLYGAVYADALFLVAALGAFILLEHDHPILAGLAGALATASRPIGIAVVVGLIAVTIYRRGGFRHLRNLRPSDGGVLLSIGGLVGWSTYQWIRWGNPLIFNDIQSAPGWDQGSGPHTWFKVQLFENVRHLPRFLIDSFTGPTVYDPRPWSIFTYTAGTLFQGLLVIGGLVLVPFIWKRIGWGYALYVLAIVGIALVGTKDFQGTGRYMLAAFPCFAVGAEMLVRRRATRLVLLSTSAVLLVILTSGYARGYYVA